MVSGWTLFNMLSGKAFRVDVSVINSFLSTTPKMFGGKLIIVHVYSQ